MVMSIPSQISKGSIEELAGQIQRCRTRRVVTCLASPAPQQWSVETSVLLSTLDANMVRRG